MLDRIIQASLRNRFLVLALAALMLIWGGWSALKMPVDVFPDLTAPTVTVATEAHGMAPHEVEQLLTVPLESSLLGSAGVRRVRSTSHVGLSLVHVEFDWDVPIHQARQVVAERLLVAQGSLPPDTGRPTLLPISSIMGEILFVALVSDRHSPQDLRTEADWTVRRRLLAVPGVSQVVPIGGDVKQVQVLLQPERLVTYGLTPLQVTEAVKAASDSASAGFLVHQGQEYLIHGLARLRDATDLENALVVTKGGHPVRLRDLATVTVGPALKRGTGSHDGEPAVVIGIQKQPGANTLELTRRLDAVMDEVQKGLPEGMKLERHIFRQADFIQVAIGNVRDALRDGTFLVLLIVGLFLAHTRATVVTAVAVPLSLVVAVLVLKAFGATLNTMTLGGMALAVGDLVDDAIVDVENVLRRLREDAHGPATRREAFTVVFEASSEIRGSIVYATAIIIVAFLPLFFLGGIEGRLLQPLGLAFTVALGASLLVALTVTPALCLWLLPGRMGAHGGEGRVVRWLKARYEPLLLAVLPRWKAFLAGGVLSVAAASLAILFMGRSFLPEFNEGTLTVNMTSLPGTPLDVSDRLGRQVEEILLGQPEVKATARRTGRAELDEHAQEVFASEIDVGLRMQKRSKEAFLQDLRKALTVVPGVHIAVGQPISHRIDHMLSGSRAAVAVKVFGPDRRELRRLAEAAQAEMAGVKGVVDLMVEASAELPILSVRPDRAALAQAGLSVLDFSHALELAFSGHRAAQIRQGPQSVDVLVRLAPEAGLDADSIGSVLLQTPAGPKNLASLADITLDRGPSAMARENGERKLVVTSNVGGRDLYGVVEDIRKAVEARVLLPQGYRVEYGGQFESGEGARQVIVLLSLVAVAVVFGLLVLAFRSLRDAALVMLNLPLAWMGGLAGVFLSGGVLSVATLIGFITLFGIATRNGVMLVTHIHHLVDREGLHDAREAVRRACLERLSPILMTALTAGLALVPIILRRHAPGSEIQAPMAFVILFGLLSSTVLNMLVVPSLYLRFGAKGMGRAGEGEHRSAEP